MTAARSGTSFARAEELRDCVHCGLCSSACPTYLETGSEADSPRGRIYLMQELVDGGPAIAADVVEHLDLCLGCRACETACPSGVAYGSLIEEARATTRAAAPRSLRERSLRRLVEWLFPRPALLAAALAPARWLERLGLLAWLRRRSRFVRLLPPLSARRVVVPRHMAAVGARRGEAALFEGCVARVVFDATNRATMRVLARNGVEVSVPAGQGCCGALLLHGGDRAGARALARRNVDAFAAVPGRIVTNAAGCGAALMEYGELLADEPAYAERARELAARVRDVSALLEEVGWVAPLGELAGRVAYHDACHLAHGMGVRQQPRQLLQRIPGMELVELEEAEVCCGSAGSYNLTQPEMAARLGRRKARWIEASGASVIAAGNPGCVLHIRAAMAEAAVAGEVVHPIELVERALDAGTG